MMTIKCPKCGANSKLSLIQSIYEGPHKCWKCRELFKVRIECNVLKSCEPMSQEEFEKQRQGYEKQKEIEATKLKFKR